MKIDSKEILHILESQVQQKIKSVLQQEGSELNDIYKLITEDDTQYFLKHNDSFHAKASFESELDGLNALSPYVHVPQDPFLLNTNKFYGIVMPWIEQEFPARQHSLDEFAISVANLHRQKKDYFGYEKDNYHTIYIHDNTPTNNWSEFYISRRIEPMIKQIIDQGIMTSQDFKSIDQWARIIDQEIPVEKPSLIHGDLWGGNYMSSIDGNTYLFDPSVYYGHREMDIAMSLLFGSFGRSFYTTYQEYYPLEKGFMNRIQIHQLYPLLVHVNLFGDHYINQVKNILNNYS